MSLKDTREIDAIRPAELGNYYAKFLVQVRKKDGQEYEPSSLVSSPFRPALKEERLLLSTIIEGTEFRKTKEVLAAKQKLFKKLGKGNKPNAAGVLTDEEVHILYGQYLLGHVPRSLNQYSMAK